MKYYLAYGMNTNLASMAQRCPGAVSLGKIMLLDHTFKFKHHADAEYVPNRVMECALWAITDECEKSLDALEGYPYYYDKKNVQVNWRGKNIEAMIYFMTNTFNMPAKPNQSYYDMVIQGYYQHEMDTSLVHLAYEETLELDIIDISAYN